MILDNQIFLQLDVMMVMLNLYHLVQLAFFYFMVFLILLLLIYNIYIYLHIYNSGIVSKLSLSFSLSKIDYK